MPTLSDTRAVRDGQRTWRPTTRKNTKPGTPAHDDLVRRVFTADGPSRLWLTDITEHSTSEGKLYCCAMKDVYSNRIVGYSISDRMTAKLAVDALENAVARRGDVAGCIVHADRGSQFRSRAMARELRRHDMVGTREVTSARVTTWPASTLALRVGDPVEIIDQQIKVARPRSGRFV